VLLIIYLNWAKEQEILAEKLLHKEKGNLHDILASQVSRTAKYLKKKEIPVYRTKQKPEKVAIQIKGAYAHNLQNIDAVFYENRLNVLRGKSGSGKTTLLNEVIYKSFKANKAINCTAFGTPAHFEHIVFADQSLPSGRANSIIASYTGLFDKIVSHLMTSSHPMTKTKKYFSLNTKGGRCEHCKGLGYTTISMDFLADVETVCEKCGGKRYQSEALQYKINEKNIADVLEMSVDEFANFQSSDDLKSSDDYLQINILQKTGLGYLKLGQSLKTLSGGELQRLKLAYELINAKKGKTLFLLDEPTNGLHFEDIRHLIILFEELIQAGHTLIIAEHHPHIWENADYLVDL